MDQLSGPGIQNDHRFPEPVKISLSAEQALEQDNEDKALLARQNAALAMENVRLVQENAIAHKNAALAMENARLAHENALLRMQNTTPMPAAMPAQPWPWMCMDPWLAMQAQGGGYPANCYSPQSPTKQGPTRKNSLVWSMLRTRAKSGGSGMGGVVGGISRGSSFDATTACATPNASFDNSAPPTPPGTDDTEQPEDRSAGVGHMEETVAPLAAVGAAADMEPEGTVLTTVMMRNIPNNYTREMLMLLMNGQGFKNCFDFLYLPVDFKTETGLGYSFINFNTPEDAERFRTQFQRT